jgi:fumarate reductase subunit D
VILDLEELIHDFVDDEISELYVIALTVLATEFECSMDDAHHGVVDMRNEVDKLTIDKSVPETRTRH